MTILKIKNKILITIILLFSISFLFRMWGITKQFEVWDETAVIRYGEQYLNYWKNLDFSRASWELNKEHPPFSKYFYGATRFVSLNSSVFKNNLDLDYPLGRRYTLQRVVSAFIGSLAVVIVFLLSKKFYDKKTGFIAALLLSFNPYFIGHSKIATQENLVAFLTLLATSLFLLGLSSRKLQRNIFVVVGLIMGLAISTKYNAFFFFIYFALLTLLTFGKQFKRDPSKLIKNKIILIPVIAITVFIIIWPWLWANPLSQFVASMNTRVGYSKFFESANEYFLGKYPHDNPWYYFFAYFLATTPLILLFGVVMFVLKYWKNRGKYDLWFLLYFLTPFLATFSPLKIDGIRYIFPVYPALSVTSAVGINWFSKRLGKVFSRVFPWIVVAILAFTSFIYHPYYIDYYNVLVGGPKNVYQKRLFDFGYWGEGLRSGFGYLNDIAQKNPDKDVYVYYKIVPVHVIPSVEANLKKVDPIEIADYVIINPTGEWVDVTNYLEYDFPEHFELVFEEKVVDVPVVQVYKRVRPWGENEVKELND